jgi:PEP-CTERM motif
MKKTIILAVSALLVTLSSKAQGLVNFNNSSNNGSKISTNNAVGGLATGLTGTNANSFYYALFSAPTSVTNVNGSASAVVPTSGSVGSYAWSDASWTFQAYNTNLTTAGRLNTDVNLALTGIAGGASADFVIVGWSANLGSTIAAVQASLLAGNWSGPAWLGQSVVSPSITVGDGGILPTPTLLAASGAIPGFTLGLVPVPEPSTMALAALGGASLLLFRRRK